MTDKKLTNMCANRVHTNTQIHQHYFFVYFLHSFFGCNWNWHCKQKRAACLQRLLLLTSSSRRYKEIKKFFFLLDSSTNPLFLFFHSNFTLLSHTHSLKWEQLAGTGFWVHYNWACAWRRLQVQVQEAQKSSVVSGRRGVSGTTTTSTRRATTAITITRSGHCKQKKRKADRQCQWRAMFAFIGFPHYNTAAASLGYWQIQLRRELYMHSEHIHTHWTHCCAQPEPERLAQWWQWRLVTHLKCPLLLPK